MSTETITWHPASDMPDDQLTVLVVPSEGDATEVWLGWYDSEVGKWRDATTGGVMFGVAYWADVPAGPDRSTHAPMEITQ